MPMPFHISIKGTKKGLISQKCCDIQGREDTILCQALKHEVYIPRDPQTGLPTGKRVHHPITVTKVFDRASPLLYECLKDGERLTDVTMKFYRINPQGQEEHYFTIKLEDAIVASIKAWIPNALDPTQEKFTHMEDVSFTYAVIAWRWEIDGVEGDDDWKAPDKK